MGLNQRQRILTPRAHSDGAADQPIVVARKAVHLADGNNIHTGARSMAGLADCPGNPCRRAVLAALGDQAAFSMLTF